MTDDRREQAPGTTPDAATAPGSESFEQRMGQLGREAEAAGKRIGAQAETMGRRLAADPGVQTAGDTIARAWGLVLIAVGAWFVADITLGLEMPTIAWRDLWPVVLIVIGVAVVLRGMTRRTG
jgi:hypothetical protein